MVWTDSQDYGADEILYIARTALFNKTNQLIREIIILFEVYPQLFERYNAAALAALTGKVDAINDMYSFVRENNVGRHYKDIVHFDDKGYSMLAGQVVKSICAVSAKGITGNPSP